MLGFQSSLPGGWGSCFQRSPGSEDGGRCQCPGASSASAVCPWRRTTGTKGNTLEAAAPGPCHLDPGRGDGAGWHPQRARVGLEVIPGGVPAPHLCLLRATVTAAPTPRPCLPHSPRATQPPSPVGVLRGSALSPLGDPGVAVRGTLRLLLLLLPLGLALATDQQP